MAVNCRLLLILTIVALTSFVQCRPDASETDGKIRVSRETIRLVAGAFQGDTSEMDAAIKAGADVNGFDEVVGPPLVAAASGGHLEAVKFLLEKGANVNGSNNQGMTALMMATVSGSEDTVRYLLTKGANPNASTTIGVGASKVTALSLARSKNNEALVKLLLDSGARE